MSLASRIEQRRLRIVRALDRPIAGLSSLRRRVTAAELAVAGTSSGNRYGVPWAPIAKGG